jgi:endonuclease G, mitochondrial
MKSDNKRVFQDYLRKLMERDPESRDEIQDNLFQQESVSSNESVGEFQEEAIVLKKGRPVLDIKTGATVIEIVEPESQIWKQRLQASSTMLTQDHIPSVGRIEVANHPRGAEWLGTGWLIRDNIVVTNRHVAELFAQSSQGKFVFRPGFDDGPMSANVDFLEELDSSDSFTCPVFEIEHIEPQSGPDLAFLRIKPLTGTLPSPVPVSSGRVSEGEQIAVIGYPARDPFFPDPVLMDEMFRHRYDKKRLAPGLVIGATTQRIFHDCSTLGGNSGGEVVSLKTGKAVALHFAGTMFRRNHAVPIDVVLDRLDKVLRGRTSTPPVHQNPEIKDTNADVINQSAFQSVASKVIETIIPIRVRVEIGEPGSNAMGGNTTIGASQVVAPNLDADDDLFETTEARPEDYRDRDGFDVDFLGNDFQVSMPKLTENQDDVLTFQLDGKKHSILNYQNFSVLMSKSRRMCRFSACNIDGSKSKRTSRSGWQFDPRIPKEAQIMKECYGNAPKFSRGHMTRREDPAWGPKADLGNRDSMHVTNAVPQMQTLNGGVWLALEDYALQNARNDGMRICVITGPFLAKNDPFRFGVKIPISFWKVIAFIHDETGELCATGYTMSQKSFLQDEQEEFVFGRHENNQRPIHEIEERAGISFGGLADLDPLNEDTESIGEPLLQLSQIRFLK